MALAPAKTILLRGGLKEKLPARASLGEPLFASDTGELYLGRGPGLPPKKIGMSDYERWLESGNSGSVDQFYEAIHKHSWKQADW